MNRLRPLTLLLALACLAAKPVKVEVRQDAGNWQLLRGDLPLLVKGVGGDHSMKALKEFGGNSLRTWGADDLDARLDEAEQLGLTVTVGIWLGHERHGFDYADAKSVAEQLEKARAAVLRYKDHPAVLMWGVGNEMEGYEAGDDPKIWKAVDGIAAMIKREDPNHPVMTVVAEIGGKRVPAIHALCPHVDVVGINTYGGGAGVGERYRAAGGTKPFVVTEFGPAGSWEVGKTDWGAPREATSTQKADAYRATYEKSVRPAPQGNLSLGSYAFIWGHKQEASATWFGLFLPSGERLESVDALADLWADGGRKPANRCPQIKPLAVESADALAPGQVIRTSVDVTDPEGDPLKIEWRLTQVPPKYETGGDRQQPPPEFADAVLKNGQRDAELKLPGPGGYWLYCVVRDGHGGAATASLPLRVLAPAPQPPAPKAGLPFVLYADDMKGAPPFVWSGWMGNHAAVAMDAASTDDPHSGRVCMKIQYKAADDFAGIVWQDPPDDWGDVAGGHDLSGAKRLTFWARGAGGGEQVEFKLGVIGPDKPFADTVAATTGSVTLKPQWTRFEIDLAGRDLRRLKTGFAWVLAGQGKPVTFYLDDVRYE